MGTLSSSNTVARRTRSGRCATGAIDAALIRSSPPKRAIGPGLERLPLFTERLVVSVTSSDSRARQESVTLADLADGPVAVCATAPTAFSHRLVYSLIDLIRITLLPVHYSH